MSAWEPRQRIVVIGAGMVGHRFVDDLVRRDVEGRYAITLVGAEDYPPYNRILLSDVLAGRCDVGGLALPAPDPAVDLRLGSTATALDLDAGQVELRDGERVAFDHVVLATGARAFVPPMPGLEDGLPRDGYVLRSLDDCRDIAARALNARRAVVLGGGLLGLEAACGLARRGVEVTLVDVAPHLAAAQLDEPAARVLADTLDDLGIAVHAGATVAGIEVDGDRVRGIALDGPDGTLTLPADLLLVSCGIRPRDELARSAGLPCGRGVSVGVDLRSPADARVAAIGDCAEGNPGLVAPGWEQAGRLAAALVETGPPRPPRPTTSAPVRLKAAGVDLVTAGVRGSQALADDRVVTVHDHLGRRHLEVVVRGSRLIGTTCVGAPDLASGLVVAYDRGTLVPADPLAMLLPEQAETDGSPALMPAATPVCRCNGVAKRDVVDAWEQGARSVADVAAATRATTGCGGCRPVVCGLVDWLTASDPDSSQPAGSDGEDTVPAAQHECTPAEIPSS